ncbi:hypothetical protein IMG5_051840 [Ichthyophthirius multifiliis]|uniref:DUF5077 domain-containing protein n=1 Tax=Ichthyophthirius multifiliis TaxID=5932 RepID=G0QMU3_ICHMU|nr:hypothetical protein IMG5_051840 [Ichthyophthirius multifiliis]EGR33453.1 hypothetical protein IMG5_051840 [Ichthyophthirius multifiliis]|eukprot:XP_004037439.1 hypothetical protein IMG5_051840 [Ichthyophthirius multifiliis]
MKISLILLTLSLFYLIVPTCQQEEVAFGWNSFLTSPRQNNNPRISEKGVQNWSTQQQIISIYFYVNKKSELTLSLNVEDVQRDAEIIVSIPQLQSPLLFKYKEVKKLLLSLIQQYKNLNI